VNAPWARNKSVVVIAGFRILNPYSCSRNSLRHCVSHHYHHCLADGEAAGYTWRSLVGMNDVSGRYGSPPRVLRHPRPDVGGGVGRSVGRSVGWLGSRSPSTRRFQGVLAVYSTPRYQSMNGPSCISHFFAMSELGLHYYASSVANEKKRFYVFRRKAALLEVTELPLFLSLLCARGNSLKFITWTREIIRA